MYKIRNIISVLLNKDKVIIRIKDEATHDLMLAEIKEKLPMLKQFYQDEKTPILVTGKILKQKEMEEIQKLINKSI